MSYDEFEALYFARSDGIPDEIAKDKNGSIGGQTIYPGHVGIIDMHAEGMPYVIEATPLAGLNGSVLRKSYVDWLNDHSEMQVWHGRVRGLGRSVREGIVTEAAKQLNKPYDIFNFDLNDDSGFYCSKLAWMSVWRATSSSTPLAVDEDPNPRRPFFGWFTPKQLLNAKHIDLLYNPGTY